MSIRPGKHRNLSRRTFLKSTERPKEIRTPNPRKPLVNR